MSPVEALVGALGGGTLPVPARAAGAAAAAALAVAFAGGPAIRLLRGRGAGERVAKGDAPALDRLMGGKAGTPTCGGLLVLPALVAAAALFADPTAPGVPACLGATVATGLIGLADDLAKLRGRPKGTSIRLRLALEALLGLGLAAAAWSAVAAEGMAPLLLPGLGALGLPFVAFAALAVLTLAGAVNAVNVTDGLDGLAPGLVALCAAGCAAAAATLAWPAPAARLGTIPVAHAGEVAVFAAATAGACAGFLWHNCHPAKVFLGNVGAAGLGGALGAIAITARVEAALVVGGAVLVAEAGSVLLQIVSFRAFGRRLFRIAPLHHRYQFVGWPEPAVTVRFWLAGTAALAALLCVWPWTA